MRPLPFRLKVPARDNLAGASVISWTSFTFHGRLGFDGAELQVEWNGTAATDAVEGASVRSDVMALPAESVAVPLTRLRSARLVGGWWRPRVEITGNDLTALAAIPGEQAGEVQFWITRRDRKLAAALVAALHQTARVKRLAPSGDDRLPAAAPGPAAVNRTDGPEGIPARLRPATVADEPEIHRLTEQLGAFPVPPWRTSSEIAAADHAILGAALRTPRADTLVLVAEAPDGSAVGVVFASTRSDYFTGRPHAHVEVVALDPAAQGQGLGRRLMAEAEGWARQRGYNAITLNVFGGNERARSLYQRLGYQTETLHLRKAL